jgi:hypothetical protein
LVSNNAVDSSSTRQMPLQPSSMSAADVFTPSGLGLLLSGDVCCQSLVSLARSQQISPRSAVIG